MYKAVLPFQQKMDLKEDGRNTIFSSKVHTLYFNPIKGTEKIVKGIVSKRMGNKARAIWIVSYGNRNWNDTLLELYENVKKKDFTSIARVKAIARHSIISQLATGSPMNKTKKN